DTPAASITSISVGTYCTGLLRYGPFPDRSGTQAGTSMTLCVFGSCHGASLKLSHPHPGPFLWARPVTVLSPVKSSSVVVTNSRCAPNDGTVFSVNVRSEITNVDASAHRFGIWLC